MPFDSSPQSSLVGPHAFCERTRYHQPSETFVARAHALGIKVHVWTIDEPVEMHRLLDLGVDGIMTDKPLVLKDVFETRGIWR